jgi:hypothetical protein
MDDVVAYQPAVEVSVGGEPEAEDSLIATIDAALALTQGRDGLIRVADHVDVLLDLRLAASETTRLRALETDWAAESTFPTDSQRPHSHV